MLLSKVTCSAFRLYIFFKSMCVPWELIPQPFALLTQCSATDPLDFYLTKINIKGFHSVYYFLKAVFMETQNTDSIDSVMICFLAKYSDYLSLKCQ